MSCDLIMIWVSYVNHLINMCVCARWRICACVCMCVSAFVYVCVCWEVYMYVCECACVRACMRVCVCVQATGRRQYLQYLPPSPTRQPLPRSRPPPACRQVTIEQTASTTGRCCKPAHAEHTREGLDPLALFQRADTDRWLINPQQRKYEFSWNVGVFLCVKL